MHKCNYCGCFLKNEYHNCPNCGSNKLEKIAVFYDKRIDDRPDNGYKINYKKLLLFNSLSISFVIGMIFFGIYNLYKLYNYIHEHQEVSFEINFDKVSFVLLIFFTGIIAVVISNHYIKKLKKLSKEGILFKNIPCKIILNDNNKVIVEVTYTNKNNNSFKLKSGYLSSDKINKDNLFVDLLIDEDNLSNYYIADEIY